MSARYKITVLPGDGIGPEVTHAAMRVLEAAAEAGGFSFEFTEKLFGGAAIDAVGDPYPDDTREAVPRVRRRALRRRRRAEVGQRRRPARGRHLQAPRVDAGVRQPPPDPPLWSGSVSPLRPELVEGLDLLIVRELTGGLYFGERGHDENGAFDTLATPSTRSSASCARASGSRSRGAGT